MTSLSILESARVQHLHGDAVASISVTAAPSQIILVDAQARGGTDSDSNIDLLVVELTVENFALAAVHLNQAQPEGKVVYDRPAIEEASPLVCTVKADWVAYQVLPGVPSVRFANIVLQGHEGVENASKASWIVTQHSEKNQMGDAVISRQHPQLLPRQSWIAGVERGFTLIELIIVIVLLGVLAVVAAPRMFNNNDFYARGFHDETLALLRYAQKTAIAQRRTVCVTFTVASVSTASLRTAAAQTVGTCDTNQVGPRGDRPGTITSKSGIAYSATPPLAVSFDGLGQPLDNTGTVLASARTLTVIGSGRSITIEPATGYVHD